MLKTIADLLRDIQVAEAEALAKSEITHPTVIGEMYEGLTGHILAMPLPEGSDLRVTKGFLKDSAGTLSRQIDCIVARGSGKRIPHTQHEVVSLEDALMAIEVKKTLYGAELEQSYENLLSVRALESLKIPMANLLQQAFQSITGHHLPRTPEQRLAMSAQRRGIFESLVQDLRLPIRVAFGYDGFASERSLRTKFIEFLGERMKTAGYGPASLPNLIISGQFSILKTNGMPHSIAMRDEDWELLISSNRNPLYILLELLFCRFNFMGLVGCELFGDDLQEEAANRFVSARVAQHGDQTGWAYSYLNEFEEVARIHDHDRDWSPIFVNPLTFQVIIRLCQDPIRVDDPWLSDILQKHQCSLEVLVSQLQQSRLANISGGELRLLTQLCGCFELPDGRLVAGEDFSGRLTRWVNKFTKQWNANLAQRRVPVCPPWKSS